MRSCLVDPGWAADAESGMRASLSCSSPPRKVVWDSGPDGEEEGVKVVPGESEDVSDHADNESSRSASESCTQTRSPSSSPSNSPKSLPLPSRWEWPRIPNPHPSLLTAVQPAEEARTGPVRPRREAPRQAHAAPVPLVQRTRTAAPVPVEGLTKKSRGRRVPTANSTMADGDIVFQAGKDGEKMTRMFACTVDGCGKCFHRGEHLKRHIRSIHTNERPHSCPEPDCLKTFSRHDNLIQHMKTHGRTLPLMLPGASASHESLDSRPAPPPQTPYRYYPGPLANLPPDGSASRSSLAEGASEPADSEVEPESEDDAAVHTKLPYKPKSEDEAMDHDGVKSEGEAMDVDEDAQHPPSQESGTHTPVLGRPRSVQVPLVFQPGVGTPVVSPPSGGRSRQTSERSVGSPQGELHCPHTPCGKTFRRGEHLRRHIKGIHLAERPHACTHPGCGKTFSRHDNLMQHAKRHARPNDGRKAPRKRTQSAQSATTEGEEPEFESEDEC